MPLQWNLCSIIVIIEQRQPSEIYGQCLSKIKVSITKQGMVSCMVNSVILEDIVGKDPNER